MLSRFSRRPRLRVVSGPLAGRPRHTSEWKFLGWTIIVEAWTELEWSQLHPAERPEPSKVAYLPGIGYITLSEP